MRIAKANINPSDRSGFQRCDPQGRCIFESLSRFFLGIVLNIQPLRQNGLNRRRGASFKSKWERHRALVWALAIIACHSACGYHVRSSVGTLPQGIQSIGIPTFKNLTNQYKIEQLISSAVLKEFSLRTRARVNSSKSGVDAVLLGEIRNVSSTPVTFGTQTEGSQTYASAFLVNVSISVKLMRLKDSSIIWQKEDYFYRDRYELNSQVRDFFSEENPALERLSRAFASDLVSTILNNSKP